MQLRDALEQLDQIHEQLTRSEVYRGFQVPAVATVGLIAFAAAAGQPFIVAVPTPERFIAYWTAVAGLGCLIGTASAVHRYSTREDEFLRRRTRRVAAQFSPCLVVGVAITLAVARMPEVAVLLPGLWGMIFGLGLISSRPHLPHGVGWVGIGFIAAGALCLLATPAGAEPSGLAVGLPFGFGHLLIALMLWRNNGRDVDDGC